jgi:ABC-type multidrug transport system fused ATPase/permease subunit
LILFSVGIRGGELAAIMAIIVIVFSRVIPMFNRLGSSLNNIANLEKWMDRIYLTQKNLRLPNDFLNQDTEIKDYRFNWDKVKFSSVKFIYPESNNFVFQNLNFEIKRGLHYAFVGYSGSGKTTAIDLFLGLLQPTEGNIFIDDKDLKEIGSKRWQRKIKYVPQKPLITSGSLRENIAFGYDKEKIDDERVIYCLKQTQIYEMAKQLSSGIYTNLGNDAITLSGGQKQRVAISRALYSNPDILILDEATSSLDAETEKIIQKTIKKLSKSITIISIAHRFSTIKNCDYIFLFNKGKITAKGDYDSLITTSKLFKKLSS